ncbi:hypothetical protein [Streptomyces sp. NPDC059783]|uniref:hypothetical protein n=1 Tax=Streptomyces sp. NPDC059783 TaxID=3346944 RepID=UPI0036469548
MAQLRRERGRLAVRAIAERADVSPTFLYENPDARALVQQAVVDSKSRHDRRTGEKHEQIEASWRERTHPNHERGPGPAAADRRAYGPAPRRRRDGPR